MDDPPPTCETKMRNPFLEPSGTSCPAHKLPFELLSYLFEFVPASYHNEITKGVYAGPNKRKFLEDYKLVLRPWLHVSIVCRAWYDVAMSTPPLWSHIIIPLGSRVPFDRVMSQLERSNGYPIDILVDMRESENSLPASFIPILFRLLLTQLHRWRSIEVHAHVPAHLVEILEMISSPCLPIASKLTSLTLAHHHNNKFDEWFIEARERKLSKHFVVFGHPVPYLNHISISGINVDWDQLWISSASNLTILKIMTWLTEDGLSWTQLAPILYGAPRLEVLVFHSPFDGRYFNQNPSMLGVDGFISIKLLHLRHLDIYLQPASIIELLSKCYIPALEKLIIYPYFSWGHDKEALMKEIVAKLIAPLRDPPSITASQVQYLCPQARLPPTLVSGVQHLSICLNVLNIYGAPGIDALYGNMNQLTSLVIDCNESRAFMELLFTPTGQPCDVKLPRLQSLTIHCLSSTGYLEVRRIIALAWERKDLGVPLRELIIKGMRNGITIPAEWTLWCQENMETVRFEPGSGRG